MALGSTTSSSSFLGNDSTVTAYTVGFRFDDPADLTVTVTDSAGTVTTLTDGVDYTLAGDGEATTATFTTATAYDDTHTVKCVRNSSQLQAYTPGTPLETDDLETAIDRVMMPVQDNRRDIDTKLDETDIVDGLTSTATDKALSAAQGKALKDTADTLASTVTSHTSDTDNPHSVTAAQVGLGNVDNTADASKPVSTAQAAADDAHQAAAQAAAAADATTKANAVQSNLDTHTGDTANPHSVTATQIGLGNVDNTADADKPISDATQTALDAKAATFTTSTGGNGSSDSGKVLVFASNGGISAASSSTSGTALTGSTSGLIGVGVAASSSTAAGKALTATADNGGQAIQLGSTSTVHLAISGAGGVVASSTFAENMRSALGIPSYADETAANSALNSGDLYFDEALGVCRLATA
jgi:hypothetical protein